MKVTLIIGGYKNNDRVMSTITWQDHKISLTIGDLGTVLGLFGDKLRVHYDKHGESENIEYSKENLHEIEKVKVIIGGYIKDEIVYSIHEGGETYGKRGRVIGLSGRTIDDETAIKVKLWRD